MSEDLLEEQDKDLFDFLKNYKPHGMTILNAHDEFNKGNYEIFGINCNPFAEQTSPKSSVKSSKKRSSPARAV